MSNLPFQQDTQSVIASVGPSRGPLGLKSPGYRTTHTWIHGEGDLNKQGLLAGVRWLILGHLTHGKVENCDEGILY